MVTIVLIVNTLIALLCLYVAWQVWKLRLILANVADTLIAVERNTYAVLHGAPNAIIQGQRGTRQLRKQYRQLQTQLSQAERVLALLSLGQRAWYGTRKSRRIRS
jgi:hypothetical protein